MEPPSFGSKPPFDLCERTFQFALQTVRLCQKLNNKPYFLRSLFTQLLRAATSVGANVEEGQGGQSRADFVSKYSIARKEARESKYWLRLMVCSNLISPQEGEPLIRECEELVKILSSIIVKAKKKLKP